MYLVMTDEKPTMEQKFKAMTHLQGVLAQYNYDGESTATIRKNLAKEILGTVIMTADSRLLNFAHVTFGLSNVYIFRDGTLVPISEATPRMLRTLRHGHNLMKLYEAGEFQTPPVGV